MPGYVIHIAIANEYIKKHTKRENEKEFINGVIAPDLTDTKSKTHYGKSPAYTGLKGFLENNKIKDSFNRGCFLHLITDYLFYNHYLDYYNKQEMYHDYDVLNKPLSEKYNVSLPDNIKDKVFYINDKTKNLSYELATKIIDEISSMDIDEIANEVLSDNERWNKYKKLV